MKETPYTRAVEKAVDIKMKAVDAWIEEFVEPLSDIGNPEKVIGKPYEEWTEQDKMLLTQVYGQPPNQLSEFMFRKEYKNMKQAEEGL